MGFIEAIQEMNRLKQHRVIKDYAVFRAVAATFYMEPMFTEDMDVIVLVESDEESIKTFRRVGEFAQGMEGMHYVFGDVPVQLFPTTLKPVYRDALENALNRRIENTRVKVVVPEYLILLYLESFRPRDRFRIQQLLPKANIGLLNQLLERFDDARGTLASRLQTVR
jgi:hypothetical protein